MAILKDKGGEIEVRIRKPPFDSAQPAFFDEYANLGVRETGKGECTRYITPESPTYPIHVTVKAGYDWGIYPRIWVQVFDKATKEKLLSPSFRKDCVATVFETDQVVQLDNVKYAAVNGEARTEVELAFKGIMPDEHMDRETDLAGCDPSDLAALLIIVQRCSAGVTKPKDDDKWEKDLKLYRELLTSSRDSSQSAHSLYEAQKVDQESFSKDGITHSLSLTGGKSSVVVYPNRTTLAILGSEDKSEYTFICRTPDLFERNHIIRTPFPIECHLWSCLKEHERRDCFKKLQDYDKEHTLKHKISLAGSGADTKIIQRELLELGDVPNRWRGWNSLLKREREGQFLILQNRRMFFEKGETPPEDLPPLRPKKASQLSGREVSESLESFAAEVPANRAVQIKQEPKETPSKPTNSNTQPEVIDLLDSPPPSPKHTTTMSVPPTQTTIKSEPIDLGNSLRRAATTDVFSDASGNTKKIKLESGVPPLPIELPPDDAELARLKEEDEELQEELAAAKRIADLLKERKEKKARILAMEQAKRNNTPVSM